MLDTGGASVEYNGLQSVDFIVKFEPLDGVERFPLNEPLTHIDQAVGSSSSLPELKFLASRILLIAAIEAAQKLATTLCT